MTCPPSFYLPPSRKSAKSAREGNHEGIVPTEPLFVYFNSLNWFLGFALTGLTGFNWFLGSAWEPRSRGSASLCSAKKRQSLWICIPRLCLGTRNILPEGKDFSAICASRRSPAVILQSDAATPPLHSQTPETSRQQHPQTLLACSSPA
jgi:hypothetical protein